MLGFTQVALLRRDPPNQPVIVHFSDDRKKLMLLDGIDDGEVKLPRELWKYDVGVARSRSSLDDKRVAVSLTIDPVNPDAVARKKADVDDIDLYEVDRADARRDAAATAAGAGAPRRAGGSPAIACCCSARTRASTAAASRSSSTTSKVPDE